MSLNMLLTLPAEIRNQIYALLLLAPPPGVPYTLGHTPPLYPQILRTSQQIHHEAVAILYGHNTFIAHYSLLSSLPHLRRWHRPVTTAALIALIRRFHIYVRLDCDPGFNARSVKEAFESAEELTVEVFQSQFGGSDYTVLRLFEDVRGVKRARVFGSVTAFPGYVAWLEGVMMSPISACVAEYNDGGMEVDRDLWTVSAL